MRIRVRDICPDSRLFRADGEQLRRAILDRWEQGEPVEVDFENESIASLSFFDEAIAVLFLDRSRDEVLSHLRTMNMVAGDRDLLNRQVGQRVLEATKAAASG